MKKIIYLLLILSGITFFISCEKDEERAVISDNPAKPSLNNPGNITLTLADSENSLYITWTPADFGFDAVVNYKLQIDLSGNNFKYPVTLATVISNDTAAFNVYELDNTLIANEFEPVATAVDMRLLAIVSGNNYADTVISDPISINITPFNIDVVYSKLYVSGSFTSSAGETWTFNNNDYIASRTGGNTYEGYIYMDVANPQFKFSKDYVGWNSLTCIGDPESAGTSGTLKIGDWGGNNIVASGAAGYYRLYADLDAKTYAYQRISSWSLYGTATGNTDIALTYSSTTRLWSATVALSAGSFVFRADNANTLYYGDLKANKTLDKSGDPINVATAGTYTISMDFTKPVPKFTMQ